MDDAGSAKQRRRQLLLARIIRADRGDEAACGHITLVEEGAGRGRAGDEYLRVARGFSRVAHTGPVSRSASTGIVRNFSIVNIEPFHVSRCWR